MTREAVAAEGVEGGFSAVYPVLRALEEAGRIRRGYFVDGLGAAQFAPAGCARPPARASASRPARPAERDVHLLAAADPANPYGAAIPWPRRGEDDRRPLQRAAGAYVVLVDGVAALYLERGGGTLQTLPAADDPEVAEAALRALGALCSRTAGSASWSSPRSTALPVGESPFRERLIAAGFTPGLPRARRCAARAEPTPCPRATRSSGPRPGSGRTSSAGP